MKSIASRQNPIVARYRAAARGDAADVVLLDGVHLVVEAVEAGIPLHDVAVVNDATNRGDVKEAIRALVDRGVDFVTVSASVIDAISPVRSSSPIVALASRPSNAEARLYRGAAPLVIVAVDVQDPGNVGAIVRVADAAGATGVVAAGASADPLGWKALRGSMGSALRLPLTSAPDAGAAVAGARRHRCRIVATVARGGRSLFEADFTGAVAILIGGEGAGLPASIVDDADERVTIPMQPPVESLNAAVTAALVVYEARRQRR
jgi:TrmH family RNA methyltransferase